MQTFKEKLEASGLTKKRLARAAGVKEKSISIYCTTNRPSKRVLQVLEEYVASHSVQWHDSVIEGEGDSASSPSLVGTIVELPINKRMRIVQLPRGKVTAWSKMDKFDRKGIKVRLEHDAGKYYVKEQLK